ncbi:hypothetical protein B0A64_22965 [Flavobacterium araucananum]|uniref:Uncharacterized protein n=1 Tax=Flavobacterium araucananum TaxID=946678 RepID=A0A227NKY2_9FLAO|nr:hypothetical protein B0A64_22965 [Flavobacterium araucananum]
MSKKKFTYEHHSGHTNINRFSEHLFALVEEMNSKLIKRWNKKVSSGIMYIILMIFLWQSKDAFKACR